VTITRVPRQACPVCSKGLDAAGSMDGSAGGPGPGDWTVCAGCLTWLVYGEAPALTLRIVSDAEWSALSPADRNTLTRQQQQVRRAFRAPEAN
jgi:hypothetical protein